MKKLATNIAKLCIVAGILYYLATSVAYYKLTDEVLNRLQPIIPSPSISSSLIQLKDQEYSTKEEFISAINGVISQEQPALFIEQLMSHAANKRLNLKRLLLLWDSPGFLAMLFAVLSLWILPLASFRWWLLLKAIGFRVPVVRLIFLTWIGHFFGMVLPGSVSGDLVKGFYILRGKEKKGKPRALITLLIDRFVGLFGLIVMAFLALLFNTKLILEQSELQPMGWSIVGLFLGTIAFYGLVIFPFKEGKDPFIRILEVLPKGRFLSKVYRTFKTYEHHKPTLIWTLVISVMIHSTFAILFFKIAQLIGVQNLEISMQLFIMPIGLISTAIPIAPVGIGVGHATFEYLYQLLGISGGADIFNLYLIVQLIFNLIGGIPYIFYSNEHKLPPDDL